MSEPSMAPEGRSPYLPLLIVLVAIALYFAFQTLELVRARGQLAQVRAGQTAALSAGAKIHAQFDALAGGTAVLAQQGDPDAKAIAAEFGRRGFNFRIPGQR
jgi:hypothetical protein